MEVNITFKFLCMKHKVLLALTQMLFNVSIPAQVLFDGGAKVLCGICGLKCVAMELVGVL